MTTPDLATVLRQSIEQASLRTRGIFGGAHAMSAQEVEEFLSNSPVGMVSSVDASGAPHMTGAGMVLVQGRLYFGPDERSALYRHLRRNPNIAVGFAEPAWRRQVLLQGSVRFVEDRDELRRVQDAQRRQHGWASSAIVEVVPRKVFTWKS